jgi:DNA repair exonuclease SbcCD ATPase subunit
MNNNIQSIRNRLEQQKGQRTQIERSINTTKRELRELQQSFRRHEQAREIIRKVGLQTQQQLEYHISDVATMALSAVFDNPYELVVEFVQRRNKTECDLYFRRDGARVDPLGASGGGAVDVAAFALRVASWSMQRPRSRNVLTLDEPFKHLKGIEQNRRVLEMIQQISHKLNIQILMISDERIPREDIITAADRVFETRIHKGITRITHVH